jgi:hypothetical protein
MQEVFHKVNTAKIWNCYSFRAGNSQPLTCEHFDFCEWFFPSYPQEFQNIHNNAS